MSGDVDKASEQFVNDVYDSITEGNAYPRPTVPEPDFDELEEWMNDGGCEATDGCWVEPDGVCEHGHPSWFLRMGVI